MKRFKEPVTPKEQLFLLPPSVEEFVDKDSPARLLSEVVDALDLSLLERRYPGGGAPAYPPGIMLKILLFAYSEGIRSSRRIAKAVERDVCFMYLAQMQKPDYRTISRFRKDHGEVLPDLFVQIVHMCQELGLVLMGHVSVDGTKIKANVSGHETYGKDRLDRALQALEEKIAEALREAEEVDAAEDAEYGDARGDELPEELRDPVQRRERLRKAKEEMERRKHKTVAVTDLESRVMHTLDGNRAAYNAQAVVDSETQVIVAADVTQDCVDNAQLRPMVELAKEVTGVVPDVVTADCGYHSVDGLAYIDQTGLNAYVPVRGRVGYRKDNYEYDAERDVYVGADGEELTYRKLVVKAGKTYRWYHAKRHNSNPFPELYIRADGQRQERMHRKVNSPEGQAIFRLRKQIVEPVFGNLKENKGLRRFLLRGLSGARTEYLLGCIAHNVGKIMPVWAEKRELVAM
jgi:transposase